MQTEPARRLTLRQIDVVAAKEQLLRYNDKRLCQRNCQPIPRSFARLEGITNRGVGLPASAEVDHPCVRAGRGSCARWRRRATGRHPKGSSVVSSLIPVRTWTHSSICLRVVPHGDGDVPEADRLIEASAQDGTTVGAEGDGRDAALMLVGRTDWLAGGPVPEPDLVVVATGDDGLAVGAKGDRADRCGMIEGVTPRASGGGRTRAAPCCPRPRSRQHARQARTRRS